MGREEAEQQLLITQPFLLDPICTPERKTDFRKASRTALETVLFSLSLNFGKGCQIQIRFHSLAEFKAASKLFNEPENFC